MKKRKLFITILVIILVLVTAYILFLEYHNIKKESNDNLDWSGYTKEIIDLNNISKNNKLDNIDLSDDKITIKESGIYEFTGTFTGTIEVKAKDGNINIILNGVTLTSQNGPAIYISSAKKVLLTLDSENKITDTDKYSVDSLNGTIYSESELQIDGDGILNLTANYKDGIVSKSNLNIKDVTLNITSKDDAIRGKNSVIIENTNITINAKGDGIKATNNEDDTLGYIYIKNGTFNITATNNAIESENYLKIEGGNFKITTGGGSENTSRFKTESTLSAKGLKAQKEITITSGTFDIDSLDDAIHSNQTINIIAGEFNITSGDDGIHADDTLKIDGGNINIKNSYEGLEAANIYINAGDIKVSSTDDGINAASSSENTEDEFRRDNFKSSTGYLSIKGGNIYVNASGDGIDSNGDIDMTGGILLVDGPISSGDGAIDYDGTFNISGGTLIAVGSAGMDESPSSSSTQYILHINTTNKNANTNITLVDKDNNEIINYSPSKEYSSIVISTPDLQKDNNYTLKIDDNTEASITVSEIITNYGTRTTMNMGGGPGFNMRERR